MAITIPTHRDDAGLQRLQKANATRMAGAVMPVGESPQADQRSDEDAPLTAPRVPEQRTPQEGNRRRHERRHGDRRRANRPVLLDTRHRQERRRQWRRQNNEAALAAASPATGIDIFDYFAKLNRRRGARRFETRRAPQHKKPTSFMK